MVTWHESTHESEGLQLGRPRRVGTPVLMRLLAFHFDRDLPAAVTRLGDQAAFVEGMVAAHVQRVRQRSKY